MKVKVLLFMFISIVSIFLISCSSSKASKDDVIDIETLSQVSKDITSLDQTTDTAEKEEKAIEEESGEIEEQVLQDEESLIETEESSINTKVQSRTSPKPKSISLDKENNRNENINLLSQATNKETLKEELKEKDDKSSNENPKDNKDSNGSWWGDIINALKSAIGGIGSVFMSIIGGIGFLFAIIINFIKSILECLKGSLFSIITAGLYLIQSIWSNMGSVASAVGGAGSGAGSVGTGAVTGTSEIGDVLKNIAKEKVQTEVQEKIKGETEKKLKAKKVKFLDRILKAKPLDWIFFAISIIFTGGPLIPDLPLIDLIYKTALIAMTATNIIQKMFSDNITHSVNISKIFKWIMPLFRVVLIGIIILLVVKYFS